MREENSHTEKQGCEKGFDTILRFVNQEVINKKQNKKKGKWIGPYNDGELWKGREKADYKNACYLKPWGDGKFFKNLKNEQETQKIKS